MASFKMVPKEEITGKVTDGHATNSDHRFWSPSRVWQLSCGILGVSCHHRDAMWAQ